MIYVELLEKRLNLLELEEKILNFWKDKNIYSKIRNKETGKETGKKTCKKTSRKTYRTWKNTLRVGLDKRPQAKENGFDSWSYKRID